MDVKKDFLEIKTSKYCNNNCVFCDESQISGRKINIDSNQIQKQIINFFKEGFRNIKFSYGEPTLNKDLILYIYLSKKLGYKNIILITNGRIFKYKNYAFNLINAGLNQICISIHSHIASTHNKITNTKNSFEQAIEGLNNVIEFKNKKLINKVTLNFTIIKQNLYQISEYYYKFSKYGVDRFIFNNYKPINDKKYDYLIPKYNEIYKNIIKIKNIENKDIVFIGVPFCIFKKYRNLIGYDFFTKRYFLDKCDKCKFKKKCFGLSKNYINKYGSEEFVPI